MVSPLMLKVILPLYSTSPHFIEGRCLNKELILLGTRRLEKTHWTVYATQSMDVIVRDVSLEAARKSLRNSGWYFFNAESYFSR